MVREGGPSTSLAGMDSLSDRVRHAHVGLLEMSSKRKFKRSWVACLVFVCWSPAFVAFSAATNAQVQSYAETLKTMKRYQHATVNCENISFNFVWDAVLSSTEIVDSMSRAIGRTQARCAMTPDVSETAEAPTVVERSDARSNIEILILAANLDLTAHPDPAQTTFDADVVDGMRSIELMPNGEWKGDKPMQDYIELVPYVAPSTALKCSSNHPLSAKAIPSRYLVESVTYSC